MFELIAFLLSLDHVSSSDPLFGRGPETLDSPKRCDNGSSLFRPDGSPNWRCRLDGCPPLAPVCWPERLNFCRDENGDDTGECDYEVRVCKTKFSCFLEWAGCDGEWNYDWETGIGTCKLAQLKPSKTAPAPGSARTSNYRAETSVSVSCPGPAGLVRWEVHHAGNI